MPKLKIAIYNRYFNTMGGGEKYTGVLASYLSRKHTVEIITHEDFDKKKLEKNLALDLSKVKVLLLPQGPEELDEEISKNYDLFINCTIFSTAAPKSKQNVAILYFPYYWNNVVPTPIKWLFMVFFSPFYNPGLVQRVSRKVPLIKQLLAKLETKWHEQVRFFKKRNYLDNYEKVIAISKYSRDWTNIFYKKSPPILYPPIDIDIFKPKAKKKIILSVGRFFVSNHNKKQLEMIRVFKKMYTENPELKAYEYHLCGGLPKDPEHVAYFKKCKEEAKGFPIFLHENIEFNELKELYSRAEIFWHGSGYQEDPNRYPDRFEHFGITTVEAMSAGAVPIVINMAGQTETVVQGISGFLWNNEEEFIEQNLKVIRDAKLRKKIAKNAIKRSKKFSRKNFHARVDQLFDPIFKRLK